MANLHVLTFQGRLGDDPNFQFTASGTAVANFNVAVDTGYGEHKYTEWYKCVAWGKLAELISEHFTKGDGIIVQGQGKTEQWEDRDGNTRYTFKVTVREMSFPAGRGVSAEGGDDQPAAKPKSSGGKRPSRNRQQAAAPAENFDPDDLPFE